MFERFTERARQVVIFAQDEARTLKSAYIGSEHLLLGLLREEEGLAARALDTFDLTTEHARAEVVRIVGRGEHVTSGQLPLTPRAKKICELALREALSLGHNYIGTEHILLGLVRENEGVAARILIEHDIDGEKVRNEVIRMLTTPGGRRQGQAMTREEFDARHKERYRKIMRREMTLAEALAENEADWRAMWNAQPLWLSGDYLENKRTGDLLVIDASGILSRP